MFLANASGQAIPAAILKNLSSEKFSDREAAQEELVNWSRKKPETSLRELHRQSLMAGDPEVRTRCMEVLRTRVLEQEFRGQGYLGISMVEMIVNIPGEAEIRHGIRIGMVQPGTAAEKAGLQANQVIVALNERIWRNDGMQADFARAILDTRPGTEVTLTLIEGKKLVKKKIRVGVKPELPGEEGQAVTEAAKERFFERWLDKQEAVAR